MTRATCTAQSVAARLAELAGAVERVDDPHPVGAEAAPGRRGPPRTAPRRRARSAASSVDEEVVGLPVAVVAHERRVAGPRATSSGPQLDEQLAGLGGGRGRQRVVGGRWRRRSGTADCLPVWSGFTVIAPCRMSATYELSHLRALEAEAIHIIREVAAEFERPVLLFSGGKDSIVMLHLAVKAFWPGPAAVPGDARRHRPQLRRGARVPRPHGRASSAPAWSWPACRTTSTPAGSSRTPARGPAATGCRPPRCSTPSRSTASTPCSAAPAATRRRPGPRSGCSASATSSASGTRRTSGPSCGASTTAATAGRAHPGVPAVELDRARHLAVHRRRGHRAAVDLLRPRAPGVPARRHAAGRLAAHPAARRRGASRSAWCASAPSATPPAPARSSPPPPPSRRSSPRSPPPGSPSAGATRADDRISEAGMEDRKRRATSDGDAAVRHRRVGRRRQVHPHRPAALRLEGDLRGPARGGRAHVAASGATSTPTWRCSPTACGPSASRASPSTSPTATSPRPSASSSSPTPPATSSTRATWSPARPPPTWR